MLLASSFGKIVHPLFIGFAWALAWFYSLVPNYAVAIALLTIAVMIIAFPITRRGTRSMMKMQILAPELKKLQTRYKAQPGMTVAERQEARQKLNEEMMAFYKENNASPTGGCLPMFLQFPIFIILYDTIRGLLHTVKGPHGTVIHQPLYIGAHTRLYHDIYQAHGAMKAFGINLSNSVRTAGISWGTKAPLIILILVAIALQYVQMKQLSARNPAAAAANPQMQQMQKVFPLIFAVIYIAIPSGVNVYFIVSSLFRIGQQEFMYRRDPQIRESMEHIRARSKSESNAKVIEAKEAIKAQSGRPKGLLTRFLPQLPTAGNGDGESPVPNGTPPPPTGGTTKSTPGPGSRSRGSSRREDPPASNRANPPRRASDNGSRASSGVGGDNGQDH